MTKTTNQLQRFSNNQNTSDGIANRSVVTSTGSSSSNGDKNLNPNFEDIETKKGKKKIVPVKDGIDGPDSKPRFQKNKKYYFDSDYGSMKKKSSRSVEVVGNLSHIYTQALLELFKKKKMAEAIKRDGVRIIPPSELLKRNKEAPLKLTVKVATKEDSCDQVLADLGSSNEDSTVILAINGLNRNDPYYQSLAIKSADMGISVAIGTEDLIHQMGDLL